MRSVTVRRTRDRRSAPLAAGLIAVLAAASALVGCLDRDTVSDQPTVKTNYQTSQSVTAVDQVDILFMIDNSTSMGDKQKLLSLAVPNLVTRLVQPNCVDTSGAAIPGVQVDPTLLTCATGTPEFPAVHDMHIGIVSSSIGDFGVSEGGDNVVADWACPARNYPVQSPTGDGGVTMSTGNDSQNDHAQLLNRTDGYNALDGTADPPSTPDATPPQNYLSWFPTVTGNSGKAMPLTTAVTSSTTLATDFASLVTGVQQFGCGFEGQLESWYQFLIQPDPWNSIVVSGGNASRVGVNTTVLKQRADFLRPGSLVAVIAVSDEDDSTVDPGAFSGTSWVFEDKPHLPLPTTACATAPNSTACTSCQLAPSNPECQPPAGQTGAAAYPTATDPDIANVRFALMKQRFGIDPQYPISRYLNGLVGTNGSLTVPDRNGERHGSDGRYAPTNDCTNPLYAASQPDLTKLSATVTTDNPVSTADLNVLCTSPLGTRDPSLVFFGFIGGVPWQLLTKDPTNATADSTVPFIAQSSGDDITAATWTQLIGNNPESYDYSGQSPYMQVSLTPRAGLQPVTASNTADPFNGREYDTGGSDLEYACTFQLPTALDCSDAHIAMDAPNTLPYDGLLRTICDCAGTSPNAPLCGGGGAPINTQTRGKAYPGIREFTLVHDMDQQSNPNGIAASLCPRTTSTDQTDPNYGYNPAVEAIIAKLKNALGNTCLPRSLTLTNGVAPCRVLELLPSGAEDSTTCDPAKGLSVPTAEVLTNFRNGQKASGNGDASAAELARPVCEVTPISAPCYNSSTPGWCYETKADDQTLGSCTQAIKFSPPAVIPGAVFSLECLESSTPTQQAGDGG